MEKETIVAKLLEYIDGSDYSTITLLVDLACHNVVNRRYPFGYTEKQEEKAIKQYSNVVFRAVVYAYNMQGAEGESSHNENGISRAYIPTSTRSKSSISFCRTGFVSIIRWRIRAASTKWLAVLITLPSRM